MSKRVGLLDIPYVELSLPLFMEAALACGYLNAEPDPDAIYRHYTVAHLFRGGVYLPLALQSLRHYFGEDFQMYLSRRGIEKLLFMGREIPVYRGRFHRINFYDPQDLRIVSAVDVIKGRVSAENFRGKAVFVGATEIGIYDVRPTPIHPATPGVFLHAFTFSNVEKRHFIYAYPLTDLAAVFLLAGIPFAVSFRRSFPERLFLYSVFLPPLPHGSGGTQGACCRKERKGAEKSLQQLCIPSAP